MLPEIEDRERLVAGLHAVFIDRQDVRGGAKRRTLALDQKAAAHRVLGGNPPAAVALHAARPTLAVGGLGDAVEQQVAGRIARREVDIAVAGISGDLEVEVADPLLPGKDAEIVDLALVLVERRGGEVADAVDGEPQGRALAADLRDLELAARGPKNGGQSRGRIDDPRNVGKPFGLLEIVVDGIAGRRRVLDPQRILQVFAGRVIIDLADAAAPFGTRVDRRLRAAIHRHRTARIDGAGLGLDVDDARGAQPVLRREGAGDQRDRIGEPGLQRLSEEVDPLGQLNSVDAELQIGMVAPDMQLAEQILGHTRSLEQELIERRVVALWLGFDRLPAETIDRRPEARLDLVARDIELLGDHAQVEREATRGSGEIVLSPGRRSCAMAAAAERSAAGKWKA